MNKEKILKSIEAIYVYIHIDRDLNNKVSMEEVRDGLEELKILLGVK